MKLIAHKERVIKVPESWDEIPFCNFANAIKNNETEITFIASLLGLSVIYLRNVLPMNLLADIRETLEFTKTMPSGDMITSFKSNGKKYTLNKSFNEMSFGQYIDIDGRTHDKEGLDGIPFIMAILFFSEDEKSYAEAMPNIAKKASEFEALPCTIVIGISGFFLLLSSISTLNFQKFLKSQKEVMEEMMQQIESFLKNTDGEVSYLDSQITTSLKLKKLEINHYLKSLQC